MNRKKKIEYLPIAVTDLEEIFEYICEDDPSSASSILDTFDKSIRKLEVFPELGIVPKDDGLRFLGYRMLIIGNYLVFYVIREDIVEIRRVIHGSRKYSFLL
ncbi:MAG: type II toxin-antitoxin system RelE/ParE family toxin [Thermoplasmatota archaeon]